jgi:hypothetical protein
MGAYAKALLNIILRRLGPEDLPDSSFLLGFSLALYLALQVFLALILFGPSVILVKTLVLDIAALTFCLWALLRLSGYQTRFRQTLTALLGTSAVLSALSAPFSLWRQYTINIESDAALPSTIVFAIMLWSLVVDGHILARALSKPFGVGLIASVIYFFLHAFVLSQLLQPVLAG